jgi:hypothetical protein
MQGVPIRFARCTDDNQAKVWLLRKDKRLASLQAVVFYWRPHGDENWHWFETLDL